VDLAFAATLLALVGYIGVTARGFSPLASVFPIFIAGLVGIFAVCLAVLALLRRLPPLPASDGSNLRRLALLGTLALWVALIPTIGFIASSIIGFVGVAIVAKYEAWSRRAWAGNILVAAIFVVLLALLFTQVLNVPLSKGSVFGG
jgi:hypothetical protein